MQKKENTNPQPNGICRRLINFIVNNFIGQGFNRVTTMGQAHGSTYVPIVDSSRNSTNSLKRPHRSNRHNSPSHEVLIDFRHIEEQEDANSSPHVPQPSYSPVGFRNRNGVMFSKDQIKQPKGAKENQRRSLEAASPGDMMADLPQEITVQAAATQGNGLKLMMSIDKNKERSLGSDASAKLNESENTHVKSSSRPPRQPPLSRDPSNINEKADEFIRTRREAMSRNYRFQPN